MNSLDPDRVAAVLVLFDPSTSPISAIAELSKAVGCLMVVDNTANGHPCLDGNMQWPDGVSILRNANVGGLAGAYNCALRSSPRLRDAFDHVLFVDEDSDVGCLQAFLRHPATCELATLNDTAACAPAYRDRATRLRARYVVLTRFGFRRLPREFGEVREVDFIINSMSLWRVGALDAIGTFNEGLGVDQVDIEYCLRARDSGRRIYVNGALEFDHSIGQRRLANVLGQPVQSGGHSSERRYYIGRNLAWLTRRYAVRRPAFALLCFTRLVHELAGILVVESHKRAKLKSLIHGAACGMVTRRLVFPAMPGRPKASPPARNV
jgi:rhamnosyltransferase